MRRDSQWPVRDVHGRLRWATPVTLPCVDMGMLVTAHARRKRAALWVLAACLCVLACVLWLT